MNHQLMKLLIEDRKIDDEMSEIEEGGTDVLSTAVVKLVKQK